MIEILKKQLSNERLPEYNTHILREFLQVLILKIISDQGYFSNLAFTGGTSLRLLFDLQRFSEDIDFSLVKSSGFSFDEFTQTILRQLSLYGLHAEIKQLPDKTVRTAWLKFPALLHQLKISPDKSQKISIKIEIDTNPPKGWKTQIALVNKTFLFTVSHFDLNSLFSTKLHACFYRKYTKGRDIYDLLWYAGKAVLPDFKVLNNAISQTTGKNPGITRATFLPFLRSGLEKISWVQARKDIERFLIDKTELKLFDEYLLVQMLENKYNRGLMR